MALSLTTLQKTIIDALDGKLDAIFDTGLNNPDTSSNIAKLAGYAINKLAFRSPFRSATAALVALLEDWTQVGSFDNGYGNSGGFWANAAYYKDPWSRVTLRGHVTGGAANTTIFTLPAGYRPIVTMSFAVMATGVACELRINTSGQVFLVSGTTTDISLDGVSFRAEA